VSRVWRLEVGGLEVRVWEVRVWVSDLVGLGGLSGWIGAEWDELLKVAHCSNKGQPIAVRGEN